MNDHRLPRLSDILNPVQERGSAALQRAGRRIARRIHHGCYSDECEVCRKRDTTDGGC